jgi:hypothetical protein
VSEFRDRNGDVVPEKAVDGIIRLIQALVLLPKVIFIEYIIKPIKTAVRFLYDDNTFIGICMCILTSVAVIACGVKVYERRTTIHDQHVLAAITGHEPWKPLTADVEIDHTRFKVALSNAPCSTISKDIELWGGNPGVMPTDAKVATVIDGHHRVLGPSCWTYTGAISIHSIALRDEHPKLIYSAIQLSDMDN